MKRTASVAFSRITSIGAAVEPIAQRTRSKNQYLQDPFMAPVQSQVRMSCWVSATHTRNFMLNDHLSDVLKARAGEHHGHISKDSFNNYIMNTGTVFEKELVEFIRCQLTPIVSVSDRITDDSVAKTIELMNAGVPVIHSAPVVNETNHTRGIIDLLVRSDYVDKIMVTPPEIVQCGSPNLCGSPSYHYIVIDIKFSTLPLAADGIHLLNSSNYPAYKAQCLIYTQAVGLIQGYTSDTACILGRRWKRTQKGVTSRSDLCLERLGVIDYAGYDKRYVEQTEDALQWVRDVRKFGKTWSLNPPSRPELYPNMCIDSEQYNTEKGQIADLLGEITSVWYCGVKNRKKAIEQGVTSWRDERCTSAIMGINGTRAPTIDAILNINRQNVVQLLPHRVTNNAHKWKKISNDMYVDFETLSDIFSSFTDLPRQQCTEMIFMIGVWYQNNSDIESAPWSYTNFVCNSATYDEEFRIMNEFGQFVKEQNNPRLWYWYADQRFWKSAENRQFDIACDDDDEKRNDVVSDWKDMRWCDMYDIFKQEPIVIKGCFKFGLKPIAKAMAGHGMITTKMESECDSGMMAMVKAWQCYNAEEDPANCDIMRDIAKYNTFDVKVMWDIMQYLRANHK
jgi:hypothetical protein